ncbi:uncharacterized protein SPSK_02872 [Sporothrix schenckii 1099-18]|uniref:Uncharacterized protein n=1 Tax=Sporothrix schenckii 1099-18 TaxID=1397361 RepID=A0A0F2MAZ0_SPOSC|nr:uncharacterized protein SPSK_02872 [Sporothrix schenckii 1099-18]KJR86249.1 hypothetical protein SPSK_02872 [Sporothrix schenckii 1099-18]
MPQTTRGVRCPAGGKQLMHGGTSMVFTFTDKPGVVAKLPYEDDDHKALFETEKRMCPMWHWATPSKNAGRPSLLLHKKWWTAFVKR